MHSTTLVGIVKRLCAVAVGFMCAALLLEGGLRVTGWVVARMSHRHEEPLPGNKDERAFRICCMGDSFTFGIGAPRNKSYPTQLEGILNERHDGTSYRVYNLGIPGQNTSTILQNLDSNFARYRPGLILLLAGLNNAWNQPGRESISPPGAAADSGSLRALLRSLKIYKLAKICRINAARGIDLWRIAQRYGNPKWSAEGARRQGRYFNEAGRPDRAIALFRHSLELAPNDTETRCELAGVLVATGSYDQAIRELEEACRRDPSNPRPHLDLAGIYRDHMPDREKEEAHVRKVLELAPRSFGGHIELGWYLLADHRVAEARREFETAVEIDPNNEEGYYGLGAVHRDMQDNERAIALVLKGYSLGHNFARAVAGLVGCYKDKQEFRRDVKSLREKDETYRKSQGQGRARYELSMGEGMSGADIRAWVSRDIGKIVAAARKHHVPLVLLGYPRRPFSLVLQQTARALSIPYVDMDPSFRKALEVGRQEDYFVPDSHCTSKGYRLMAETVARSLAEWKIIPPSPIGAAPGGAHGIP